MAERNYNWACPTHRAADLIRLERTEVKREAGAQGIRDQIQRIGRLLCEQYPIRHIGIGFGGPVENGVATKSHQVSGWDRFPLAAWSEQQFGLPTAVENDCNVAAIAEATYGAGRGLGRVFYVTIGTGIGGGFVVNGTLYGAGAAAVAEIGHLRPGLDCTSASDTVESLASGLGMALRARKLLLEGCEFDTSITGTIAGEKIDSLSSKQLAVAREQGCPFAKFITDEATRSLGWAIAQMSTLLAPEIVVCGGGVSLSGSWFLEQVQRHVKQYVFPPLVSSVRIEPTELDENSVVIGAIVLASHNASL
ncbi:MAG: ROK family protein [Pirellulaceae bacterium]